MHAARGEWQENLLIDRDKGQFKGCMKGCDEANGVMMMEHGYAAHECRWLFGTYPIDLNVTLVRNS